MIRPVNASWVARGLNWFSWLSLAAVLLAAGGALFCEWAINADSLGAHDMGLALSCATIGALLLLGSVYAVPVLAGLGALTLYFQRPAGFRFLIAAAVAAVPLAVLTWLA
jgi:hypothetical protein